MRLESTFKAKLKEELRLMFPGCIITNLDPNEHQGIPDMLILWKDKWATLEGKRYGKASKQPNQEYYVNLMNEMSFSRVIYPENKEEVLDELQSAFRASR